MRYFLLFSGLIVLGAVWYFSRSVKSFPTQAKTKAASDRITETNKEKLDMVKPIERVSTEKKTEEVIKRCKQAVLDAWTRGDINDDQFVQGINQCEGV